MPPSKRRTRGGRSVHHGRVTTHDETIHLPTAPRSPVDAFRGTTDQPPTAPARTAALEPSGAVHRTTERADPASSARYTSPQRRIRFRPGWHKAFGVALLVLGILVAALNDVMMLQPGVTLLPGGHNELYLFAGVAVASYSAWWFGWFDRTR
jgi:hypothetical protein